MPRKHVEEVDGTPHKLGVFVDNARRRANKPNQERRAGLDVLGMRWQHRVAKGRAGWPRGKPLLEGATDR